MNAAELILEIRELKREACPPHRSIERLDGMLTEFVRSGAEGPRPDFTRATRGLYTRLLLNSMKDDFQVVLVLWGPGSRSPIHDHSGTVGMVAAYTGVTRETKYTEGATGPGGCVQLERGGTTVLRGGATTPILPSDGMRLHDMANETAGWSATVHVYLTPILDFHIYEPSTSGYFRREPRELWFDAENAWRGLTGPSPTASGRAAR
ncbi:cysteine dioxygenase [Actinomadura chibensis]|uniref:Cysteine dioxygenase n=1 Tax=Actinomadura chibensis TaxID=392828 RepID=A0A5D0NWJ2_9ACTN|nr:cysteine dioxygenase family protein [Actinomadura chibensis]TYB49020.1 hypothetical protein FXF69_07710 [Actinomadura chibensis]